MKKQEQTLEELMRKLFRAKQEYSKKSDGYIMQIRLLAAQQNDSHTENQIKAQRIREQHKKLTQTYHKTITTLHEEISQTMAHIA